MSALRENIDFTLSEEFRFKDLLKFRDKTRFFLKPSGRSLYVFDRHTFGIHPVEEDLVPLFLSESDHDFETFLSRFPPEEQTLSRQWLRAILDGEDSAPRDLHNTDQVSNIKLNLDNACNLACRYCFRGGSVKPLRDTAVIQKAIDYTLLEAGRNAGSQSVGINLTSEPLLDIKFLDILGDCLKKAVKQDPKRLRNVGFFFITNGTVADKSTVRMIRKLRNEPYLHISIDGPKEVHDAVRVTAGGEGTYDRIVANLKLFKKGGLKLRAEGVLTRLFPKPMDVILHLLELGFETINLKPVRSGTDVSFGPGDLPAWRDGYREYFRLLGDEMTAGRFGLFQALKGDFALKYLPRILLRQKIKYRCFWGINNYSMDSLGDFYPCDSLMGIPEFKVGSVETGLDWAKYHADTDCEKRGDCGRCWARHLCGGTCHAAAYFQTGHWLAIDPLECAMNRYLAEQNLELLFRMMEEGGDIDLLTRLLAG
jgi:uncharacterized protein